MSSNVHVVVGDAHVKPGQDLSRFLWLGKLVLDLAKENPDRTVNVIDMGDWADMPSLSSYDVGKKSFEGRRYSEDVKSAMQAREVYAEPFKTYNLSCIAQHKKQLRNVKQYQLGGNHCEGRIKKVIDGHAILDGTISVSDVVHPDWTYSPFLKPLVLDGLTYSHYFVSGVMGRPISGESPGLSLIKKTLTSSVSGHSHLLDLSHRTDPHGKCIWGIQAGCFLAKDQWEDYAGPANKLWKRGVLLLFDVADGDFKSFKWIGIEDLEKAYS